MEKLPGIFETYPSVYAVCDRYIITVAVNAPCTMWVTIGAHNYYDDSNGILKTSSLTHKIEVPSVILNQAGYYTLNYRIVNERKPYFSELTEEYHYSSIFRPLPENNIRIFHVADAHNRVSGPVSAAKCDGDHDLLILNGDIPNHSGDIKYFNAIHNIAGEITKGEYPVIFSRGNHDMRGICAELIADHTPTDNGKSYYSAKLGPIWALVLDCGEDKPDTNAEYGNTICCHEFRRRQTDYIKSIIQNAESEYLDNSVNYKLIISHIPFSMHYNPPFNIEEELYAEWCQLIKSNIAPNIMIAGHVHSCNVYQSEDTNQHPCTLITASKPIKQSENIICGSIVLSKDKAIVKFVDSEGTVHGEHIIDL